MIFTRVFIILGLAAALVSAVPNPRPTAAPTGLQRRYIGQKVHLAVRQDNDDDDDEDDGDDDDDDSSGSDNDDLSDLSSALDNMNSESYASALASLTEDPDISSLLEFYTNDGFKSSLVSAVGSSSASEYLSQASASASEYRNDNQDDEDHHNDDSDKSSGLNLSPQVISTSLFVGAAAFAGLLI